MIRVFSSDRCFAHGAPYGFPERPERLRRVLAACAERGWETVEVDGHEDTAGAVVEVHDPDYVERFRRAVERGDGLFCSGDNPLSEGTWEAARAAVDVILTAVDWAFEDGGRTALAAVRPPGHHAERATAMGFCYFNNVAVAADRLVRARGLERVAIFDFDVHHGNGTQHLFEERADVLYASTHQYPFYPGTGAADETGRGAGAGATLNVPLRAGTDDAGYRRAIAEEIVPALRDYAPRALLLSAGFDAWKSDPIGGMRVTRDGFAEWGRMLGDLAAELCGGSTVSVIEGGYDLEALGDLTAVYVEALDAA